MVVKIRHGWSTEPRLGWGGGGLHKGVCKGELKMSCEIYVTQRRLIGLKSVGSEIIGLE